MLTINFVWTCDYCEEAKIVRQGNLQVGYTVLEPSHLPHGWNSVHGKIVCPKHTIVVKDRADA